MKKITLIVLALCIFRTISLSATNSVETDEDRFDVTKDLLLAQFDCKTDVDDLHTVAAMVTLLSHDRFSNIDYHAIAGTYGTQGGLYVPPNSLFKLAFDDNWTDAHDQMEKAVESVMKRVKKALDRDGDIWIAEAGQSDFSAALVKAVKVAWPDLDTKERIHIVQHSGWNEQVTSPESLSYVKENADYIKIPDGNAVGNGTPGFKDADYHDWASKLANEKLKAVWLHATELSNEYNGKDGRYNNEAISAGGLDFSDLSEVCWILNLQHISDTNQFFETYGR